MAINCTPNSPKMEPKRITTKRTMRPGMPRLKTGTVKEAMAVKATMITTAGEMMPARMAASPRIKAPTMLMAGPIIPGRRSPASRNNSNTASIRNASTARGRGTPSWEAAMRK